MGMSWSHFPKASLQERDKRHFQQADIQVAVGERIARLRKIRGFTQDQFAAATGLNRTHLYRLETGQQSMTLKTLKLIADSLGVRVTHLLRGF
jgi:DNA-binding XRE family transcriptional regulator